MAATTDLALDLASMCDRLAVQDGRAGDAFLAEQFTTEPWSVDFYEIIRTIIVRTHALSAQLQSANLNEVVLAGAEAHLARIREAFNKPALVQSWNTTGYQHLNATNSSPIRMLSGALNEENRYPALTAEEKIEVSTLVDELLGWLRDKQLSERDFIRQSLIEGLELFKFRLDRLEWFGWGYSIDSLRGVIAAYFALERGLDPITNPDAGAVLMKTAGVLQRVFSFASKSKKAADTADWVIDCYKYASAVAPPAVGYIAGLLT
jgi:hypothetical protein